ncbi:S8 family peptidase [Pontiella agarivorans]|uniref:S8 family serine peptidase n=1 Tax=Pontiella agarivorans TaxID=3038953 RepID=A0ABU5MYN9_9BACT|nr:S8 family serine peptidase [Pontiella agarivorans]MDZ8119303.1 S8 family serine peptidase [Pontiella agarivorans]
MMKIFPVIGALLLVFSVQAATLRIEGEEAWLKSEGTPLSKILFLFEQRGAEVLIDPALELGRVTGEWEGAKVERLIAQLVSPNSYSVQWKRVNSPLGEFYQVSSIRVFGDRASAAKRLSEPGRVLDVVEGTNGVKYVRGEILVGFREGSTVKELSQLLRMLNGTVVEVINPPGIYRIRLNDDLSVEEALAIAAALEGVDAAEPNLAYSNAAMPTVPISGTHAGINLGLAPGETAIAVFDSGLDPVYADMDFIRGSWDALNPGGEMDDPTGHGTLVSLIASGAITPQGEETGNTGAPVLAVKVFDENGMTSSDVLMSAINYALASDVDVINLSFGTYEDVGFLENAVEYAASQGIAIFVASGNDGLDVAVNPAANPVTVSVAATDGSGHVAGYSNTAADTYASGTVEFDGKVYYGTSFASPRTAYEYATRAGEGQ